MYKILMIMILLLGITGCGSSTKKSNTEEEPFELAKRVDISDTQYFRVKSPKECTQENKNRFIYQVMHDSYLWNTNVPELDYTSEEFNTSEKLLHKLRDTKDRFSFIMDAEESQSFFEEGKKNGFGLDIYYMIPLDEKYRAFVVRYVYPDSPAQKAGIKRGDVINLINNKSISEESFDEIVDTIVNDNTITFGLIREEHQSSKVLTKKSFDINTILHSEHYVMGEKRVGYMVFQDFIPQASKQIDRVFEKFKSLDTNELILDLRYNLGGDTEPARHLASLIGGSKVAGNVFQHDRLNEYYSVYNGTTYFKKNQKNALNLDRVFVITTEFTCSSSELVMNALQASENDIEVIQIGTTTCGKPYGFLGAGIFCKKALFAINVVGENSDGVAVSTDGLNPTCSIEDDVFSSFGDEKEASLAEALHYIQTDACSSKGTSEQKIIKKISRKPLYDPTKKINTAY